MLTVSRRKAKDNVKRTHPQCTCTVQLRDTTNAYAKHMHVFCVNKIVNYFENSWVM